MRKKWKMRGGIVLLLGVFILSIGSISWAKATSGKLYCYSSPPQIKSQKKEIRSKNQRGKIQYEKKLNLNLTPEQMVKLTQLRLSFQEQTIDLRGELAKKIIELQKLWLKKTPNRVKMYSLIDEIAEIKARINKKAVNFILKAREILTQEQLKKLLLSRIGLGWRVRELPGLSW
ncbi:hypothetical protein J7M02_02515 [Candidatus Aerophobetes bacterium]|nr:hypothetical protein [Candidatus Aerophobetes bacterium]